jgi:hypothetical protein
MRQAVSVCLYVLVNSFGGWLSELVKALNQPPPLTLGVCGQPKHTVLIGKHLWEAWIEDFFRSTQEEQRSQAN